MFKSITEKPLWVNMLAGLGLLILIVILFFYSLDWIANHNKSIQVPMVESMPLSTAQEIIKKNGFEAVVQDSVYDSNLPPLTVVKQSPEAETLIKQGRAIYLSINRAAPPLIEMPNLIGFSFKSAALYLENVHLKLGDTSYKPDIAKNTVLEQYYNGQPIKTGEKIPMGSRINFVLGSGIGGQATTIPNLYGLSYTEALSILQAYNLNKGSVVAIGTITDTATAYIINQTPSVFVVNPAGQRVPNNILPGQVIDLYITKNPPPPQASTDDSY